MPFFRNKRLFIFLIGFIVLVALIGFSLKDRENLSMVEQFINDTVGWAQNIVHTPVTYITGIFKNIDDLRNTYNENQILREQLGEYKGLVYDVQELKEENEELRDALELIESDSIRNFHPIQATVISRSPEQWLDEVTINKGKQDGVSENMVVITAEGMVGKIQTAQHYTSKVQLLTGFDQFNRISATISRGDQNDIFGMIEGFDDETNTLMFRIIEESDKDVEEGEMVVSSGMGGVFPAGMVIGAVTEVVPDQYGLTRTALVEPAADLYEINHVMVLDRQAAEPEEEEEEEE
ncbi:rod shape-determining protein MreC [Oceanobacillus halophilus]|uniref:Cell shape-determining protein MreC n=1 Tax=Oceanobacillus halophilus TaxID=930130 RepID=A0A495ADV1_9BACI|nr:rod shape-determining protein MreC [Oceanobacillus halophilus]RKQ37913.1 rod shape-determining protein MreC [Oceanobacillus halophilus]